MAKRIRRNRYGYRFNLDTRLLARVIREAPDGPSAFKSFSRWITRANKRLRQIQEIRPLAWDRLEDLTVGVFLLDYSSEAVGLEAYPKPICGKETYTDRFSCERPRGQGTNHIGYDYCYTCEQKMMDAQERTGAAYRPSNETVILLNRNNRLPSTLAQCLVATEVLTDEMTRKVEPDIKTLYALIQFVLEGGLHEVKEEDRESGNFRLSIEDIKTVNTLSRTLLEAKKVRHVMDREVRLDPATVKNFVGQVLAIVWKNMGSQQAKVIGAQILDQVIRPFRLDGRLTGNSGDYDEVGKGMLASIAKFGEVNMEDVSELKTPVQTDAELVPNKEELKSGEELGSELANQQHRQELNEKLQAQLRRMRKVHSDEVHGEREGRRFK